MSLFKFLFKRFILVIFEICLSDQIKSEQVKTAKKT